MIEVNNITKEFKVSNREPGLLGALKGLFKPTYKTVKAVDDISFNIKEGEIIGFIGSNGAGKSTTIKMMCGVLYPTSGNIVTNQLVPYDNRVKNAKSIGVVFGQRTQLQWDIALEESLRFQKYIYNIDAKVFEENLEYLVETLELKELLRKPIRQMSLGQRMRSELAVAFLHNPKIVYLDEPTIGLDVRIKEIIRAFIVQTVKKFNTTVILTTHDMQDIEELATRIIIIDEGKIVFEGPQKELMTKYGNIKEVEVTTQYDSKITVAEELKAKCTSVNINDNVITLAFSISNITVADVINNLLETNEVIDINISDMPLENIVKDIYSKEV